MAQAVQAAARPKFRGNKNLKSKVVTHYPAHLEREYMRITDAYMVLLNKTLAEYLPTIRKAITDERAGMRQDSAYDNFSDYFREILEEFERRCVSFGIRHQLERLANLTRKLSIRAWKRVVHKTLGINILEDYYMGEFYRSALTLWVQKNVDLMETIPKNTLGRMKTIVEEGYRTGKATSAIGKEIQEAYKIDKRRARFIARDQMAKLNADIAHQQQKDAGVEEYVWSSSGDGRVRDCHKDFDKKKFKWSDPPENWYDTKSKGRVYVGHYHPMQAPGCRCVALPVFNLPELNLPWEGTGITDVQVTIT